jgi:hypothetical protein
LSLFPNNCVCRLWRKASQAFHSTFEVAKVPFHGELTQLLAVYLNHPHFVQRAHGRFDERGSTSNGYRLPFPDPSYVIRLNWGSASSGVYTEDTVLIRIHPRGIGGGHVKVEVGINPKYLNIINY